MRPALPAILATLLSTAIPALAASPEWMAEDCATAAQSFFQEFEARTEMKYEGQRTDGTHAMNGTIYLENSSSDIQCSYDSEGTTMVDFVADGESWPDFAKGGKSPYMD
ncbi:MAG: hypothetical protein H6896_09945 [Rhodovulum sp.]|nr:hypothetical protein [Paracoccaceae bacterium]MCC0067311.1 hypothetical protein [Rhodovulum sp.]